MHQANLTGRRALNLSALLIPLALACGNDNDEPTETQEPVREARFEPVVEAVMQTLEQEQALASGITLAVMERGEIVWAEGFGSADPSAERAIATDTTFQIGS